MDFHGKQPREGTAYKGCTWNIGEYRRIRSARSKDRLTSEWEVIGGVPGEGRAGAALVWGDGRATRRGKLDGRVQGGAGGAGSMSAGRGGAKWAGAHAGCRGQPSGTRRHLFLFETVIYILYTVPVA